MSTDARTPAAATRTVDVVAFDLMDTLIRDPFREALEAALDRPLREVFSRRDPAAYPALERGELTEQEFWDTHRQAGITVDPDAFHRTRRAGYAWIPGMRELLCELRDHPVRVVVASNYPAWIRDLEQGLLDGLVDAVHASCRLGARKPDQGFYEALVARVGVALDRVAFVDDRPDNVAVARRLGMVGIEFVDAFRTRQALAAIGVGTGAT